MATQTLNTFADVQQFITKVLTDNGDMESVQFAPHEAFWNTLSYEEFVTGNVPGVTDPDTGQPMPILSKGDSAHSNLILALRGEGPTFGPDGTIGIMPAGGTPLTQDQIQSIADWIDRGCPN